MAFDVVHIETAKGAASTSMEEEEDRTNQEKTVNADPARAQHNFSIHAVSDPDKPGKLKYVYDKLRWSDQTKQERIQARLNRQTTMVVTKKDGTTYTKSATIRKDAITHINLILSGDHDVLHKMLMDDVADMKKDPKKDFPRIKAWAMDNFRWLAERSGGARNVVTFNVHLDESTPHIQATVVPMYTDKEKKECRLNHKKFVDGPLDLKKMRTDHAERVGKKYGLERGIEGSKSPHEDIGAFYRRLKASNNAEAKALLDSLHTRRDEARKALKALDGPVFTTPMPTFGKEKWLKDQEEAIRKREQALIDKHIKVLEGVAEQAQKNNVDLLNAFQKERQKSDQKDAEISDLKKQLKQKDGIMDKIAKALKDCVHWAIECFAGTANKQWLYEKFEAYCEVSGANEAINDDPESIRLGRQLCAQRVALDSLHALSTEQLHNLEAELDNAVQHPEIGRGQGIGY